MLNRVHDNNLYNHPHSNRTDTEIPNGSQDLIRRMQLEPSTQIQKQEHISKEQYKGNGNADY